MHRPGDSDDTKLLRAALEPYVAVRGDDPEWLDKARELALASFGDWRLLAEDRRDAVLSVAAARAAKDARDRRTILSALASVEEPGLVARAPQLFLTSGFDAREAVSLLFAGMDSAGQRRAAFDFTTANLAKVEKQIPADITGEKGATAIFTAWRFCSARERAEAEAVFGRAGEDARRGAADDGGAGAAVGGDSGTILSGGGRADSILSKRSGDSYRPGGGLRPPFQVSGFGVSGGQ